MPTPRTDNLSFRRPGASQGLILAAMASAYPAYASPLPTAPVISSGSAQVTLSSPDHLVVRQTSAKAVINWSSFSIDAGKTVEILNGGGTTLNRVTGAQVSRIDGALSSDGSVYLVNPNGVVVGASGVINTQGAFVASTLGLSDEAFNAGGDLTFSGNSTSSVVNLGRIGALGGDIVLMAHKVENRGQLEAPKGDVGLLAGAGVVLRDLSLDGGRFSVTLRSVGASVTNGGVIRAAMAELRANGGNIYALAGNTGEAEINATAVAERDGRIWLVAEGGTPQARVTLSATRSVETSGDHLDVDGLKVVSPQWLLDPYDLVINASLANTISTALATTDVTLITSATDGVQPTGSGVTPSAGVNGNGDIILSPGAPITWSSSHVLQLNAAHSLYILDKIRVTGGGGLKLNYGATGNYFFGFNQGAFGGAAIFTTKLSNPSLSINGAAYTLLFDAVGLNAINATSASLNGRYALANSIDLTGTALLPIGAAGATILNSGMGFTGSFTGLGNTLSNNNLTTANYNFSTNWGMFGALGPTALVRDLALNNWNFIIPGAPTNIGLLFGRTVTNITSNAAIRDVSVSGTISTSGSASNIGGLGGLQVQGNLARGMTSSVVARTQIKIAGNASNAGGVFGFAASDMSDITSYSNLRVDGIGTAIGGIAGAANYLSLPQLQNLASYGSLTISGTGGIHIGGLIGVISGVSSQSVSSSLSATYISAPLSTNVGALFGLAPSDLTLNALYWDATRTGTANPIGKPGLTALTDQVAGHGLTTAQLQSPTLAPAALQTAGWSILNPTSGEGVSYPYLQSASALGYFRPLTMSGKVYSVGGVATPGATVRLYNGLEIGTGAVTGADGGYYFMTPYNAMDLTRLTGSTTLTMPGATAITGAYSSSYASAYTNSYVNRDMVDHTVRAVSPASSYTSWFGALGTQFGAPIATQITNLFTGLSDTNFYYTTTSPTFFAVNSVLEVNGRFRLDTGTATPTEIILNSNITIKANGTGDALVIANNGKFTNNNNFSTVLSTPNGRYLVGLVLSRPDNLVNALTAKPFYGDAYINLDHSRGDPYGAVDHQFTLTPNSGSRLVYDQPQTLTVTANPANVVYDSLQHGLSVTVTGYRGNDAILDRVTQPQSTWRNVGSYTFTPAGFVSDLNYSFVYVPGTLVITPRPLTINAAPDSRVYDGTTSATGFSRITTGLVSGDNVTLSGGVFNFLTKTVGAAKTVTLSGLSLTGADAGNYNITALTVQKADITAAALNVSATVNNKTYDATTSATGDYGIASGRIGSDVVNLTGGVFSFSNKSAANGKAVSLTGLTLTGADAVNYSFNTPTGLTANITKANLTLSALPNSRTYDGTTSATGSISIASGLISGDAVSLSGGVFAFADKLAGAGKTVSLTGLSLTGLDAANYSFTSPTGLTANMSRAVLSLTATADSRTYDGTTSATGSISIASGLISGDAVSLSGGVFAFADKLAGAGKSVSLTGLSLTGLDAANYSFTSPTGLTASINKAILGLTASANSRTYDGTTRATGSISIASGLIFGDAVSLSGGVFAFADKLAGAGKSVSLTGLSLTGLDAANYSFTSPTGLTASINKAILGINASANNRTYDGTTSATGSISFAIGVIYGDAVSPSGGDFAFADKLAGAGKSVSLTGLSLTGPDAANYSFTTPSGLIANIDKAALRLSASANSRTYDGTTSATGNITIGGGQISGDDVSIGNANFAFLNNRVGTTKTVRISGVSLTGLDAGNYTFSTPANPSADITPAMLTLTLHTDSRPYDGTTSATGSVNIYSGLVNNEQLTVSDIVIALDSKNVGVRTDTLLSVTLNGFNAGNYDVGNILYIGRPVITPAPIRLNAVADSRIYDGTSSATGYVQIADGVFGTDDLAIGGGVFAFADKAAGRSKSVSVTGLSLTGLDAANYTFTHPSGLIANIDKAALTLSALPNNRTYDGTTSATGSINIASGLISGDAVSLSGGVFSFADKLVGVGKSVRLTGLSLTGLDAANYSFTTPSGLIANIDKAALSLSASANSRTYDGTTSATGSVSIASGVISGDAVSLSGGVFAFADKLAGVGKSLNLTGLSLTGADAGNYSFNDPSGLTADIAKAALNLNASVHSRIYDGTTLATGAISITSGLIAGDAVGLSGAVFSFADKMAGAGKAASLTGLSLSGADADNYSFTLPTGLTADIDKAGLTLNARADNKTYDGTTSAPGGIAITGGLVSEDQVNLSGGVFSFTDNQAGEAKTVNLTGLFLSGADAGNYNFTTPGNLKADIAPARLTLTADVNNRTYDATTDTTGQVRIASGLFGSDDVQVTGASFAFENANAGSAKAVTVSGLGLSGADRGNYTFSTPMGLSADITPASLQLIAQSQTRSYSGAAASDLSPLITGLKGHDVILGLTQSYDSKNAGVRTLGIDSGYVISDGNGGANYVVSRQSATGRILPTVLWISAINDQRVYDTTTASSLTPLVSGLQAGDSLSDLHQSFDSKNVGARRLIVSTPTVNDGAGGANYQLNLVEAAGRITPAELQISARSDSRTYDGRTDSGLAPIVEGLLGTDQVTSLSQGFDSKSAGARRLSVKPGLQVLDGNGGANYHLTVNDAAGSILKATLTLSASADSRVYDGTSTASGRINTIDGLVDGDQVATSGAEFHFADKSVGRHRDVTLTGLNLTGADAENYRFEAPANLFADITPRLLELTARAKTKVYDGTTAATGDFSIVGGLVDGDVVQVSGDLHFADKSAGVARPVLLDRLSLTGADAGNYVFQSRSEPQADITPALLTLKARIDSRTYDGGVSATGQINIASGLIYGDVVQVSMGGLHFADKNAGTAKTVIMDGLSLSGLDASNYRFSMPTDLVADIRRAILTISAQSDRKTYDATTRSTLAPTVFGLVTGDTISDLAQAFDSPNASTSRLLRVSPGYHIDDGAAGGNYQTQLNNAAGAIYPAHLRIAALSRQKVMGQPDPNFDWTILEGSLLGSDNLTLNISRKGGENPAKYAMRINLGDNPNYFITVAPGTFTIFPDGPTRAAITTETDPINRRPLTDLTVCGLDRSCRDLK